MMADEVIARFGLQPHPEGGYFAETFRDPHAVDGRSVSTAILFLLKSGEISHWHRVDAAEIWHHYAGAPLQLRIAEAKRSQVRDLILGDDFVSDQYPQIVVPAGHWQSAQPRRMDACRLHGRPGIRVFRFRVGAGRLDALTNSNAISGESSGQLLAASASPCSLARRDRQPGDGKSPMKTLPFAFFAVGIAYVLFGMAYGIDMSIREDFTNAPAHAHLNLLGFVIGAIFAFYYHLVPAAVTRLAWAHFWMWQVAVVTMFPGVIMAMNGQDQTLAKVSSILAVVAMLLFAWIFYANRKAG
jgi:predicted cupin superfamily sugar epimerase